MYLISNYCNGMYNVLFQFRQNLSLIEWEGVVCMLYYISNYPISLN